MNSFDNMVLCLSGVKLVGGLALMTNFQKTTSLFILEWWCGFYKKQSFFSVFRWFNHGRINDDDCISAKYGVGYDFVCNICYDIHDWMLCLDVTDKQTTF